MKKYKSFNSVQKIVIFLFLLMIINCTTSNTSTKGKVIEIDPSSVEYLSNTFDQILVFFLDQKNQEYETFFQEFVKEINQTYPNDNTLYAVTYLSKNTSGKLSKFNNKSDGFRIITKRNHYQMEFNNQTRQFTLLKRFYSHHIHPTIPIFIQQQYQSIDSNYFVVFQYNTQQKLKQYTNIYRQVYDYLKIFNVKGIATQSTTNSSKVQIYNKQNLTKPLATYANQLNNTEELIDFINVETLPLIAKLDDENYVRVFGSFLDTQMLLIYDQKDENISLTQYVRHQLRQVAHYNREQQLKYHRILFAQASIQFLRKYFDDSIQQIENKKGKKQNYKIVLTKTDYGQFQLRRFNYDVQVYGNPTKQTLIKFIDDVRMKRIDSQYKSQNIPLEQEQRSNILRKIVGKSFISEIYQKPLTSVIVLFVDSKDPESYKDIKEAFQNFTKKYKSALQGKVVCAIFDLAKNQHKFLSIRTAPMLSLFERTNKKSPKNFKGYPKVESIKNWVNYQIKDFTIPQNFGEQILPLGASIISNTDPYKGQL